VDCNELFNTANTQNSSSANHFLIVHLKHPGILRATEQHSSLAARVSNKHELPWPLSPHSPKTETRDIIPIKLLIGRACQQFALRPPLHLRGSSFFNSSFARHKFLKIKCYFS
jgi:hypothetical protein